MKKFMVILLLVCLIATATAVAADPYPAPYPAPPTATPVIVTTPSAATGLSEFSAGSANEGWLIGMALATAVAGALLITRRHK